MKTNNLVLNIITVLFLSLSAIAQDQITADTKLPGHPRILLLKGEEAAIKKTVNADKIWTQMQQSILNESDNIIDVAPLERVQIGRRLLSTSREALRRLFFLSYA